MGLVEFLVLLAAVGGSSWMVGMLGWLWYRTKRIEDAALGGRDGPKALLTEVEELKDAVSAGDRELERMTERLDFLERLLTSGEEKEPDRPHLGSGTEVDRDARGQ